MPEQDPSPSLHYGPAPRRFSLRRQTTMMYHGQILRPSMPLQPPSPLAESISPSLHGFNPFKPNAVVAGSSRREFHEHPFARSFRLLRADGSNNSFADHPQNGEQRKETSLFELAPNHADDVCVSTDSGENHLPFKRKCDAADRKDPAKKPRLSCEVGSDTDLTPLSPPGLKHQNSVAPIEGEIDEIQMLLQKESNPLPFGIPIGSSYHAQTPHLEGTRLPSPVLRLGEELAANRTPSPRLSFDVNQTEASKDAARRRMQDRGNYLPYRIRYGPPLDKTTWDRTAFSSEFPRSSIVRQEDGYYEMGQNPALSKIYDSIRAGNQEKAAFPLEELGDVQDDDDDASAIEEPVTDKPTCSDLPTEQSIYEGQSTQSILDDAEARRRSLREDLEQARVEVALSWSECTLLVTAAKKELEEWRRVLDLVGEISGTKVLGLIEEAAEDWATTINGWDTLETTDHPEEIEGEEK